MVLWKEGEGEFYYAKSRSNDPALDDLVPTAAVSHDSLQPPARSSRSSRRRLPW